jgi:hypothetical protein
MHPFHWTGVLNHAVQGEQDVCLLAGCQAIDCLELDLVAHSSRDSGMPDPRHADDTVDLVFLQLCA